MMRGETDCRSGDVDGSQGVARALGEEGELRAGVEEEDEEQRMMGGS